MDRKLASSQQFNCKMKAILWWFNMQNQALFWLYKDGRYFSTDTQQDQTGASICSAFWFSNTVVLSCLFTSHDLERQQSTFCNVQPPPPINWTNTDNFFLHTSLFKNHVIIQLEENSGSAFLAVTNKIHSASPCTDGPINTTIQSSETAESVRESDSTEVVSEMQTDPTTLGHLSTITTRCQFLMSPWLKHWQHISQKINNVVTQST